ncbi:hypothetical protein DM01DRAFT_1288598 [Hesseltinella vesiculosa]|uniref:Amino acid transporter transmembrane domain-containing protein n=1 Tax=Hesseltinella vesiculosa TaxID=101127 RepID=A0A1X2GFX1_9FUNG|nr:hypothetical protein DM01DRAFT_1288598 [Hesseltinella vesiculosa]
MNIPNAVERGEVRPMSNLHPTQYGAVQPQDMPSSSWTESTFSDRVGSWVGSCSRTSLMYMAENVARCRTLLYLPEERANVVYFRSMYEYHPTVNRLPSHHDRPSLAGYAHIDKVDSIHSTISICMLDAQKSSFLQSAFNSINVLAGVGILALPLGFKCTGWVVGILLFAFCLGVTNHTAKLLGRCLSAFPECLTYGDIGRLAFKGKVPISLLFLTELTTVSVALVVLLADGLEVMLPHYHPLWIKVLCFFILTPMLFFPVRHLSYTSLVGIFSALFVVFVLFVDGLSKPTTPGSLWEPADTILWPVDFWSAAKGLGLIVGGFAGHAVFPTIFRDMAQTKQYSGMVDFTYLSTAFIYLGVAAGGYRMFGSSTMQEITQNLVAVPEYNQALNRALLFLIALNPISKYALTLNPVVVTIESIVIPWFSNTQHEQKQHGSRHRLLEILCRTLLSLFIVILAYILPDFSQVMALVGSFFSFAISGIFPIMCYLKLFHGSISILHTVYLYLLLFLCLAMAIAGTIACFV